MPHNLKLLLSKAFSSYCENIAVVDDREYTYKELEHCTSEVHDFLIAQSIGVGDRVAVITKKSFVGLGSITGVVFTGAVYVPIDIDAPMARAHTIMDDAKVQGVVCDKEFADELLDLMQDSASIVTHNSLNICFIGIASRIKSNPDEDLAYILYTSGSTGSPKGVKLSNANALSFIEWAISEFEPTQGDRILSIAPFHFDLSIFDIYVGLACGASIALVGPQAVKNPYLLSSIIEQHQITTLYTTPTVLRLLTDYGKLDRFKHESLHTVIFAGEIMPGSLAATLMTHWKKAAFFNLYGPTETNVCTSYSVQNSASSEPPATLPIGRACANATLMLLDVDGSMHKPLPGNQGELLVSGPTVFSGYAGTNDHSHFIVTENRTWYKTGDLVKVGSDEDLMFVGRKDRMVKRNGYRIELGEIECTLRGFSCIRNVVVKADVHAHGSCNITAFVELKDRPASSQEIRKMMLDLLPAYMLPDRISIIKEIPHTNTHKVDPQKLI